MNLRLITANKLETFIVAWLEIHTPTGDFVIQRGHAPTVFVLSENMPLVFKLDNGKQQTVYVRRGIAECTRSNVQLIIDEVA